jgi:hypothetical protein
MLRVRERGYGTRSAMLSSTQHKLLLSQLYRRCRALNILSTWISWHDTAIGILAPLAICLFPLLQRFAPYFLPVVYIADFDHQEFDSCVRFLCM